MLSNKTVDFFTLNPIGQIIAILAVIVIVACMLCLAGTIKAANRFADALNL